MAHLHGSSASAWTTEQQMRTLLASFPTVVLTERDVSGHPFSVRVSARVASTPETGVVLVLGCTGSDALAAGPGSVLCHRHDAQLRSLRSFVLAGDFRRHKDEWVFVPKRLIPGAGAGGPVKNLQFMLAGRHRAGRYLTRRGMSRPAVPWVRLRER